MTVLLLGVGADSTNSEPTPPVYPDGRFEYVPIPEARGPSGTVETRTYGNTDLRHRSGSLADYLDCIRPRPWGERNPEFTGDQLADWPLHHDPNFEALTYGETTSRGAYTKRLRSLDEGDGVAFYTGLRDAETGYRHRYLIGYFTVAAVVDCQHLDRGDESACLSDLSAAAQNRLMDRHRENAHAKRFLATGQVADDDGLVIVDGRKPGGLLEQAVPISEHGGGGHHYLTDDLQERLAPEPGGNPDRNAYLGGIKPAHTLRISVEEFRRIVEHR